jgi:ABC-type transport system involved in multi-copper enzyme maturation permease subunit
MLSTLIKKEILNNLLNMRFALAYFLCTFLLVGSSAIMFAEYLSQKKNDDLNKSMYEQQARGFDNAPNFLGTDKNIARSTPLTRIFALGAEKDPDPRATINAQSAPYYYGDFKRNPLGNLFPPVDLLLVVGIIMSLLIFVLTYDMISGEREEGTLRLLLCCPVPRDMVLAAKWLGGFISLAIPFLTSAVIIMLILTFNHQVVVSGVEWLRIVAMFGVCLLYIATVFSLSMMVSTFCASSSTAILSLLLSWVVLIVAVPAISTPLAVVLMRPAGVEQTETAMQRYPIAGIGQILDDAAAFIDSYKNKNTGPFPPGFDSMITVDQWQVFSRGVDSAIETGKKSFGTVRNVERAGTWIARVSPMGSLENALVSLAGTGINREADLRQSVETYARACIAYGLPFLAPSKRGNFSADNVPAYRYPKNDFARDFSAAMPDCAILICMCGLFSFIALIRFVKSEAL